MEVENERPLTVDELAHLMGCSRPVIDAAIKTGQIPHTRLGRRIFIPRRAARALLDGKPLN
jgi:excisionase family DNA binding protein